MTSKIRKLYNVLVVGGVMAAGASACKKEEPKQPPMPTSAVKEAPAPTPVAEPAKTEPAKAEPAKAEPPPAAAPEPVKAEPAKPVAKTVAKPKAAPAKKAAAKKDGSDGSGVAGWS